MLYVCKITCLDYVYHCKYVIASSVCVASVQQAMAQGRRQVVSTINKTNRCFFGCQTVSMSIGSDAYILSQSVTAFSSIFPNASGCKLLSRNHRSKVQHWWKNRASFSENLNTKVDGRLCVSSTNTEGVVLKRWELQTRQSRGRKHFPCIVFVYEYLYIEFERLDDAEIKVTSITLFCFQCPLTRW